MMRVIELPPPVYRAYWQIEQTCAQMVLETVTIEEQTALANQILGMCEVADAAYPDYTIAWGAQKSAARFYRCTNEELQQARAQRELTTRELKPRRAYKRRAADGPARSDDE